MSSFSFSLDREAFTFTEYKLDVRIEPEQQRLAVRGTVTVRNDSNTPQKNLSLQISSSLGWRTIQIGGKPAEFVTQPYISDIDHTGNLSEAIVTLAEEIPPKGTVKVSIGYEGTIVLTTTRLMQAGVPDAVARRSDWDRISADFTGVRGIGYVAWYPIATEGASLEDGSTLPDTIERWKARHSDSSMEVLFRSTADQYIWFSGNRNMAAVDDDTGSIVRIGNFTITRFGINVPVFVSADYQTLKAEDSMSISYLPGNADDARAFAETLNKLDVPLPLRSTRLQVLQLPEPGDAPFITDDGMLTSLAPITTDTPPNLIYAIARQSFSSPRSWIQEGIAHYGQLLYIEKQSSRQAALDYLKTRRDLLVTKSTDGKKEVNDSLINGVDGAGLQVKAMWVWWMLREMLGDQAITAALLNYRSAEDKEPSYLPQLLAQAKKEKDLEWFFDDWVYRDRGLPDFRVAAVNPRKTLKDAYIVTVVVENIGGAGAEIPVTIHFKGGEATERLIVKAKSQASIRFTTPIVPDEVVLNDGSVPESDLSNNTFKVPVPVENP